MAISKPESVLAICAHNDDQILGAGGTLIHYVRRGLELTSVIFSYGERHNILKKREVTTRIRIDEAEQSDRVLGGKRLIFYGLEEGRFTHQIQERGIKKRLAQLIQKIQPRKIFTHASDDPHPDHKSVNTLVRELLADNTITCDVYSFDVWNFVSVKHYDRPKLVVDVSSTFRDKIRAFRCHRSQKATAITQLWNVYLKAFLNGLNNNVRYAEVFYKIEK